MYRHVGSGTSWDFYRNAWIRAAQGRAVILQYRRPWIWVALSYQVVLNRGIMPHVAGFCILKTQRFSLTYKSIWAFPAVLNCKTSVHRFVSVQFGSTEHIHSVISITTTICRDFHASKLKLHYCLSSVPWQLSLYSVAMNLMSLGTSYTWMRHNSVFSFYAWL